MFERLTQPARTTLIGAQESARLLHHEWVGTEHLALALATDQGIAGQALRGAGVSADSLRAALRRTGGGARARADDLDADALRSIGIDLDDVRRSVEQAFGTGALDEPPATRSGWSWRQPGGAMRFTDRTKKTLERALRAAMDAGDRHIGTEHLLLGLLDVDDSHGVSLIVAEGVDPAALRATTTELMRHSA